MIPVYGNDKVKIDLATNTSFTLSINPTAGGNRKCYIAVGWYNTPGAITYCRYNGIDATLVDAPNVYFMYMALYECNIPNSDSGAVNITMAWTTSRPYCVQAFTFANASMHSSHSSGSGLGGSPISMTLTSNDIDTMILCTIGGDQTGATVYATPSDTLIQMTTPAAYGPNGGAGYRDADPTNTTMTATRSSTDNSNTVYVYCGLIIPANSYVFGTPVATAPFFMI
jgi:hypothetical protein